MATSAELKLAILDFIDQTDRYEAYTLSWLRYDEGRSSTEEQAAGLIQQLQESRAAINESIQAVGGLALQLEDEQGTPTHEVRLGAWLGHDPDDMSKHLWKPLGAQTGQYLSIDPGAIAEMRDRLITQATTQV